MKKIFLFLVCFLAILIPSQSVFAECKTEDTYKPFSDVDPFATSYYEKPVELLSKLGIVQGYPDGTFRPTNEINRAEMLKILAEGAAIYQEFSPETFDVYKDEDCFPDVKKGEWYTKYVCYAKAKGWVQGYENGKYFKPSQTVNFVEGMKMALEAFGIEYDKNLEPWYRGVVNTASENLYIPCIWRFDAKLWREEMADIIARIIKADREELASFLGDKIDKRPTYETIEANDNVCFQIVLEDDYCFPEPKIIEMKSTGFEPANLEVKSGDSVKFINETKTPRWPASEDSSFADCEPLNQYESCTFRIDRSVEYNDLLHKELKGTITIPGQNFPSEPETGYIW